MKKRKVVFILIDGVGDVAYSDREWKTPLQESNSPNIDFLAKEGLNGMMYPFEPGKSCGSDTAHLSLFSYNPILSYFGRGCFECMGAGLMMDVGDIGFKCNFSTIEDETEIVIKRRCSRTFEKEGPILCEYLDEMKIPNFPDYELKIKYATEHRCGIRIRGPRLSNKITGTDPLKDNLKLIECKPTIEEGEEGYEDALTTSKIINSASNEIRRLLKPHEINTERKQSGKKEANLILFRGAGMRLKVKSFQEKHNMKGFMIAPTCIISGLGKSLEIDVVKVEGATGDIHSNFCAKGKVFVDNIKKEEYDFGFLHIKGVDDASHEGNVDLKVKLIENVDVMIGDMLGYMEQLSDLEFVVVVTGDHSTPCSFKDHSFESVPVLISGINFDSPRDKVEKFNEIDCSKGNLGFFSGMDLFDVIKRFRSFLYDS